MGGLALYRASGAIISHLRKLQGRGLNHDRGGLAESPNPSVGTPK